MCASGKRSLAAARELRKHGLAVRSLAGGLQALVPPETGACMRFQSKLPDVGTTIFTVMSRRALEEGALNIGQGFPDYPIDPRLSESLLEAVAEGHNQYAPMEGRDRSCASRSPESSTSYADRGRSADRDHRHLRRHRGVVRCDSSGGRSGR